MSIGPLVKELQKQLTKILNPIIPRAAREVQLLLMHHLECDELWLMTHQNHSVDNVEKLYEMVRRRAQNEPFEYITNTVSFYSREFYVDKGALIPRPETEILIDEVIIHVENPDAEITFAEVGVGSGIISIMLALHFANAKFIAVDISPEALRVAGKNIEKFGLTERIELRLGSLLDEVDEKIDYLVSNPPYIADKEKLETNLSYEPQNALFGGNIGDEIIKELLNEVLKRDIKFFTCEMGYDQKDKITAYLKDKKISSLEFYNDLSGFDRGFTLRT